MVLPIAATPVLKGKEADRFRKQEIRNRTKCVSKKQVEKAIRSFLKFVG